MEYVEFVQPVLVSILLSSLLFGFYLYKSGNDRLMKWLSLLFVRSRYKRADMQRDTRSQDAMILLVLIIIVPILGLKLIMFQVVVSDSMKPVFERGDMVLSQTMSKDPQVGDIITFVPRDDNTKTITHRVVTINNDRVTTKGDNNPFVDDPILKKEIVAKAVNVSKSPIVVKGVGKYFILDFSKEGALYKFGDKFDFMQSFFLMIRTWGYVITAIAIIILVMNMMNSRE